MNITFLIGNGFDLNLGLDTSYSSFCKYYKNAPSGTENIFNFKKHIKDNELLWANAELALGQYTEKFEKGEGENFSECHRDICEKLSNYLKAQESRIEYDKNDATKIFNRINKLTTEFPTIERENIDTIYKNKANEIIVFNFINFNYTNTVDKYIEIAKKTPEMVGFHKVGGTTFSHTIGQLFHVHGTVDKDMVFGTNDESQIAKPSIFECENGDLYKSLLIKKEANEAYMENTDIKVSRIIKSSDIIYVYGMSIGETDKLWWNRICLWLKEREERHVIIHDYNMPRKKAFPILQQIFEKEAKKKFVSFSNLDENGSKIINRIHITKENIFNDINSIAKGMTDEEMNGYILRAEAMEITLDKV